MPVVNKTKVSTLQRVGNALSGALQGAKTGTDIQNQFLQAQQKQQQLAMEQQQLDMQHKEMQAKLFTTANQQISSLFDIAIESGDPESAMNTNRESYERWSKFGEIQTPFDDVVKQLKDGSKLVGPAMKKVTESLALLGNPNVSFDKKQAAYEAGSNSLNAAKGVARNQMYMSYFGTKKNVLDQAYQEASRQEAAIRAAQAKAEIAKAPSAREGRLANEQVLREMNKFESSPDIKPLKETFSNAAKAEALLNEDQLSNAVEPVKIMLAAAFNQGRPTDRDAEAMAQNQSFMNAVKRFGAGKGLNMNLEADKEQFKLLASTLSGWAKNRYSTRVSEWASGTAGLLNTSEQELADMALKRGGVFKGQKAPKSEGSNIRKQVNKKTGAIRYVDENGKVVDGPK